MYKRFENMRQMIENCSVMYANNIAFKIKKDNGYKNVTYKDLRKDVEAMSKYLISNDLINKRVAVIGENCYSWMVVYLGVLSAGGVIVPLDRGLLEHELFDQLNRAKAEVVFCTETFYEILSRKDDLHVYKMECEEFDMILSKGDKIENDAYENIHIDCNKMSILIFTSGTTSKSKAVMLSQSNILSNVYSLCRWERFYENDISMALLPFHHSFGMVQTLLFLSVGMCSVFCEGLRVAKCLTEYGVTVFVAVPVIVEEIKNSIIRTLKKQNKLGKINMLIKVVSLLNKMHIDVRRKVFKPLIDKLGGGLRFIIVGAAPANPETLDWLNSVGIFTVQGYGLSETSPVVSAENDMYMRSGSVGKAMYDVQVKVVDKDENGFGELAVKGENVMLGYYEDEEATSKIMDGDWLLTGDIARIDKDGYIFLSGRKKNVIVLNTGKNVFPEELEFLLDKCDAIKECIVFNNNKDGKDCISAKIVYQTELEYEEAKKQIEVYIEQLNNNLPHYKHIMEWEITDIEMEKTTTKKIKR